MPPVSTVVENDGDANEKATDAPGRLKSKAALNNNYRGLEGLTP